MSEKEKYITKSTLKERGWSEKLIQEFLPLPREVQNPHYSRMSMYLWKEKDVIEAEKRQEFADHLEKRKVFQKRAQAAVRTKNEKMKVILAKAIEEIEVQELDYEEVVERALQAKQNWYDMTDQYERCAYGADEKTVQRWTVNYIRHNLTKYDAFLWSAKGKTGISFAYPLYRKAVLEKISDVYPYLCEECGRQISRAEQTEEEKW
ncbi:MAG: hypothetical protein IJ252_11515 [Solobacterium sp.]|nr:hypothetical protein [Solobacterium sp.]